MRTLVHLSLEFQERCHNLWTGQYVQEKPVQHPCVLLTGIFPSSPILLRLSVSRLSYLSAFPFPKWKTLAWTSAQRAQHRIIIAFDLNRMLLLMWQPHTIFSTCDVFPLFLFLWHYLGVDLHYFYTLATPKDGSRTRRRYRTSDLVKKKKRQKSQSWVHSSCQLRSWVLKTHEDLCAKWKRPQLLTLGSLMWELTKKLGGP